jgi:hypothetical protein
MADNELPAAEADAAADAPAPAKSAAPNPIVALIEDWWNEFFPGSPVAQVTSAWNHAYAAKEELKRRLGTLTTGAR